MFCTILNLACVFKKIEKHQGKAVKGNIRVNPLRFASTEVKFEIISFTLEKKKVVYADMTEGKFEGEVREISTQQELVLLVFRFLLRILSFTT